MARSKEWTNLQKELIVKLWKESKSYRKISDYLNIPSTTIRSLIAGYKNAKRLKTKRTGAPRKISARCSRKLMCQIKQNPNGFLSRVAGCFFGGGVIGRLYH